MPASVNACSKMRFCESVSTVEPDFDETTIAVLFRSPARASPTWSASVESRTTNSTPAVRVMTSGASDEPPIPQRTKRVTPLAANSSRKAMIESIRGAESSAELTHPSRIDDSASASLPHRVKSLAAMRLATLSATKTGTNSATAPDAVPEVTTFRVIITLLPSVRCQRSRQARSKK
ncbi:unannotated protein [freshwater metagenome]|uniref:Unannotated protein n=1 Tax=freshwater metagenome TaxID=449393 RepID=A0A6J6JRF6_9ZZZZ